MTPAQSDAMQAAIDAMRFDLSKHDLRDLLEAAKAAAEANSNCAFHNSEANFLLFEAAIEEVNGAIERFQEHLATSLAIYARKVA